MKYNIGGIVPFEQTQDATDWVNSVEGCYYLEDYAPDENGNMQLIVRQLVIPELTLEEQIEQVEKYCKENNLLMSGGSDCHGDKHKDLELGTGFGNLVVNEEAIKEWI